jgi:hypothetical protein
MTEYGVVLFHSTAHAIRGEKVLLDAGFAIKMIPTPRQLSSDCGMALRFGWQDRQGIAGTLETRMVPINGIHQL